jgi:hypothetical protein
MISPLTSYSIQLAEMPWKTLRSAIVLNYLGATVGFLSRTEMRMPSYGMSRLISRAWYYFRLGYGSYLTFVLGYVSTLVTVYYLAIKNIPSLLDVFPKFVPFAILSTVIGVPLSVSIGWVHMKQSNLLVSEAEISMESSPYTYKLAESGINKDVYYPGVLLELKVLRKLAEARGLLTDAEKAQFDDLEQKYSTLLKGGFVGSPRRSAV